MRRRSGFAALALVLSAWPPTARLAAEDQPHLTVKPTFVGNVSESSALGFGNGPNFVFDGDGNAYFSAATLGPDNTPSIAVYRLKPTAAKPQFERVFVEDADSLIDTNLPHVARSIAVHGKKPLDLVWSGYVPSAEADETTAPQIHVAQIAAGKTLAVLDVQVPFTISGYGDVYPGTAFAKHPWQDFPAIVVTPDGVLHVSWEGRDVHHESIEGEPIPFIAYATRSPAGVWSVTGTLEAPPYLDAKGPASDQRRPALVAGINNEVFAFCYGAVNGKNQILFGKISGTAFSGWSVLAPSDGDQRHVTATLDKQGVLHAVWREEKPDQYSFIAYSTLAPGGKWTKPLRTGKADLYASIPSIAVTDQGVFVSWIEWASDFLNSADQVSNGFPEDNDKVEGTAYIAEKPLGAATFAPARELTGGTASYPIVAEDPKIPSLPFVVWAEGRECASADCIQLFYGELKQ